MKMRVLFVVLVISMLSALVFEESFAQTATSPLPSAAMGGAPGSAAPSADIPPANGPEVSEKAKIDWAQPDCVAPKEHDEADLCQQKSMVLIANDTVFWAKAQTLIGIVSVVFGFFSVVMLGVTIYYTHRTLRLTTHTTRAELQAYVSMNPRQLSGFVAGQPTGVSFITKNTGQTPAYGINYKVSIAVLQNPLPDGFRFPEPEQWLERENSLFPGADMISWFRSTANLTGQDIASVTNDTARIHVWGRAIYVDAFGAQRHTDFSASVGGPVFAEIMAANDSAREFFWAYGKGHNRETFSS